jgi:hypothetical protein
MIKPQSPKDDQWKKNEKSKPQSHPKATFDIFMTNVTPGFKAKPNDGYIDVLYTRVFILGIRRFAELTHFLIKVYLGILFSHIPY